MNDTELHALACFVLTQALQRKAFDDARLGRGLESGYYGDLLVTGQTELENELERRGVILSDEGASTAERVR